MQNKISKRAIPAPLYNKPNFKKMFESDGKLVMFWSVTSIQNKRKKTGAYWNSYGFLFLFILFRMNIWLSSATIKHPPIKTRPKIIVIRPPALHLFYRIANHRYIFFTYVPSSSIKPKLSMKDLACSVNSFCSTFITFKFLCFIISSNVKYVFVP